MDGPFPRPRFLPATRGTAGAPQNATPRRSQVDGDHVLTVSVSTEDLERARADNPSLLNRRF